MANQGSHFKDGLLLADHSSLQKHLNFCHAAKVALMITGSPGIGKSDGVKQWSKKRAQKAKCFVPEKYNIAAVKESLEQAGFSSTKEESGRRFIEWTKISSSLKRQLSDNTPEGAALRGQFYIYFDIRLAQSDPTDVKGLPLLDPRGYVEWIVNLPYKVMGYAEAMGTLFFDEITLSPPMVQGAAYQIILDRQVGESSLAGDLCIVAAGNKLSDKSNVFQMSKALRMRFSHVQLKPPMIDEWSNWAYSNKINPLIISFLNWKSEWLVEDSRRENKNDREQFAIVSPRTWEFTSRQIDALEKTGMTIKDSIPWVYKIAGSCVGASAAMDLKTFAAYHEKLQPEAVLKNPALINADKDMGIQWAYISAFTSMYDADHKKLKAIVKVSEALDKSELQTCFLRMLTRVGGKDFKAQMSKDPFIRKKVADKLIYLEKTQ